MSRSYTPTEDEKAAFVLAIQMFGGDMSAEAIEVAWESAILGRKYAFGIYLLIARSV